MKIDNLHLGASLLNDRVYIGKVDSDGKMFIGPKKDVTSDFLKAIIDIYAGYEVNITDDNGNEYVMSVKRVKAKK